MSSTILILGGGHAGAQAVETLRREGFAGRLVLVSEESELPYQRPPLSKKCLAGELSTDQLHFRDRAFYMERRIELHLGARAIRLDPAARRVVLSNGGQVVYDQLLLCLGSVSRRLTCPGADLRGVQDLRSLAHLPPLRAGLQPGARAVIIGGGYIGLETAATARKLGCEVTVLELAERVMQRVVAPNVSEYFSREHQSHGTQLVCNSQVVRLEGADRVERVVCADGSVHPADLVIVGVGASANDALAQAAGLACDNGILVDQYCRTTDPAIHAAGDCTNHPSIRFERRVRLESVDNAFEQAKTAALNMLGRSIIHDCVPCFWSDQFDNRLQIVGLSAGHDQQITRGDPSTRKFTVCYLTKGLLQAVEAVNQPKDYIAARKLIAKRAHPDPAKLADPGIPLQQPA